MTPDLPTVGMALYGPSWRKPLAAALGVSDRSLRHWLAGTYRVPAGVRGDLARLCRQNGAGLIRLADDLEGQESPTMESSR